MYLIIQFTTFYLLVFLPEKQELKFDPFSYVGLL